MTSTMARYWALCCCPGNRLAHHRRTFPAHHERQSSYWAGVWLSLLVSPDRLQLLSTRRECFTVLLCGVMPLASDVVLLPTFIVFSVVGRLVLDTRGAFFVLWQFCCYIVRVTFAGRSRDTALTY
jgi:hypothetical protein